MTDLEIPRHRGRNDCPCGTPHRPFFGQWWHESYGSQWYCDACAAELRAGTVPAVTRPGVTNVTPKGVANEHGKA